MNEINLSIIHAELIDRLEEVGNSREEIEVVVFEVLGEFFREYALLAGIPYGTESFYGDYYEED